MDPNRVDLNEVDDYLGANYASRDPAARLASLRRETSLLKQSQRTQPPPTQLAPSSSHTVGIMSSSTDPGNAETQQPDMPMNVGDELDDEDDFEPLARTAAPKAAARGVGRPAKSTSRAQLPVPDFRIFVRNEDNDEWIGLGQARLEAQVSAAMRGHLNELKYSYKTHTRRLYNLFEDDEDFAPNHCVECKAVRKVKDDSECSLRTWSEFYACGKCIGPDQDHHRTKRLFCSRFIKMDDGWALGIVPLPANKRTSNNWKKLGYWKI
ncbi:hypothetical protein BDV96DRAFT_648768 [Lophiotrema nucula]|uniref:Uncharacterized protein n=1 Tax=Lophiotrema nucula TaxID=690887 RepID=A0A6A5YZA0_9PLEO|nr:hypothetical protein BDV96DRAFT_648768 [Lophiotrema nucula]